MTSHEDFVGAKPIAKDVRRMYADAHSLRNQKNKRNTGTSGADPPMATDPVETGNSWMPRASAA